MVVRCGRGGGTCPRVLLWVVNLSCIAAMGAVDEGVKPGGSGSASDSVSGAASGAASGAGATGKVSPTEIETATAHTTGNATLLIHSPFILAHDAGSGYLDSHLNVVYKWTKTQVSKL
jgi:hypothetical protein